MNIYILDSDQQKIPDLLADDDLSAMIEDIANALLSAHVIKSNKGNGLISNNTLFDFVFGSSASGEWVNWITECAENYDYLVSLGLDCCREFYFRFNSEHKKRAEIHTITIHPLQSAIEWCSGNRPDLSVEISLTKFPLVMPGEFKLVKVKFCACEVCDNDCCECNFPECCDEYDVQQNYRNYYAHTLKGKEYKYTLRERPGFLNGI